MDILFIKIIDIIIDHNEETDEIKTQKVYLPIIMKKKDIEDVFPAFTNKGKLYKNISGLKKYHADPFLVVGNYKDIIKKIEINNDKPIGYKNDTKTRY